VSSGPAKAPGGAIVEGLSARAQDGASEAWCGPKERASLVAMKLRAAVVTLGALAAARAPLAAQESRPVDTSITLRVPVNHGTIALDVFAKAIASAAGLDASEIDVPARDVQIDGFAGRLATTAIETLTSGAVWFDRTADDLVIYADPGAVRGARRAVVGWIRGLAESAVGADRRPSSLALRLPEPRSPREPVVLLVHGIGGDPDTWSAFRRELAERAPGLPVAALDYAPHEAVEDNARALSAALKEEARAHPGRPIHVVAHSLGGLVARAVVETPELDPGNVATLVLLGTPSGGSRLSRLHFLADAVELALGKRSEAAPALLIADLFGEATSDLAPGSDFLERLASRGRNPRVRYRLVLGTRAPLASKDLADGSELVRRWLKDKRATSPFGLLARDYIRDLDELVDGKGDGAVSLRRGALPGVEPWRVPVTHSQLTKDPRVVVEVVRWLQEQTARADAASRPR